MRSSDVRLLPSRESVSAMIQAISSAHSRIYIITTILYPDDPLIEELVTTLCDAADRGVKVSIGADSFTYIEPREFGLRLPFGRHGTEFRTVQLQRRFRQHNVQFRWLGSQYNFTFMGRTHSKWTVVDDTVFCFGGVNLDRKSLENIDYQLCLKNSTLANSLIEEQKRIVHADKRGGAYKSHKITLDKQTRVLFDGGRPFDSIIYRRTCELARLATRVTLVSQYCPTGTLIHILKKKEVTLYFNHWRIASPINSIMIQFGMLLTKLKSSYSRDTYLHAKVIIFTLENGEEIAISGSHNFMSGSGASGTREVAIETSDKHIVSLLKNFIAADLY